MTAPQLTKNWTISPNVRLTPYVSLVATMGWFLYQNKTKLLAAGWTLIGTSNGTTAAFDGIGGDRWTSASVGPVTRGTAAAAPQSWAVLENIDGVQILLAYQGAGVSPTGDDIARVSFSPGGIFVIAGTVTHQPTATDEVIITAATSVINATGSLDRVMQIFTADNSTGWRCAVYRNSSLVLCLSLDKVTPIAPGSTLPIPYVGGKFTDCSRSLGGTVAGATPVHWCGTLDAVGSSASRGFFGSIFTAAVTRVCRMFGISALGHTLTAYNSTNQSIDASTTANTFCASMGGTGALVWPIVLWGEETSLYDGPWCTLIDWGQMVTTSATNPATGNFVPGLDFGDDPILDPPRTNWFVAIGAAAIWPWKDAAPSMEVV
jgi:hypothetical protein